ncbi:MAG: glycosyltransferase [Lachnospiraceae bacterium]|nr:glycosyltransferase [Lachnospiraceae bacterium]
MTKILFAINTLGRAGAEKSLIEICKRLNPDEYDVSLYVVAGQGELVSDLPDWVKLINTQYDNSTVLDAAGKKRLKKSVFKKMFVNGSVWKNFFYLCSNGVRMLFHGGIRPDKLLWKVLSDASAIPDEEYDLAVAFIEGGAAYFVRDHVKARKKAAFIHIDYNLAGYTRKLDRECYLDFDRVFAVSGEVRNSFLAAYPELEDKTDVLHNIVDAQAVMENSEEDCDFGPDGVFRILTVNRLDSQKALNYSIDACKILKDSGLEFVWIVLGDGSRRRKLEKRVKKLGLTDVFLMPGSVKNPYPYMRKADIYVHASRFEGKSIAIREAQILGKPILVSDCNGNREQVIDRVDGLKCELSSEAIANSIKELLSDEDLRQKLGTAAGKKHKDTSGELSKLLSLTE